MGILDCDESDTEEEPQEYQPTPTGKQPTPNALRIQVRQSPYLDTCYCHNPVRITIDSEDTGNMIRLSIVQKLKYEICKSAQTAHQAVGSSPLKVIGETELSFTRGQHVFQFERLVVENVDVEVHARTLFMEANDIAVLPAKCKRMAPLSHTALLIIVLHSKLRLTLWFSVLDALEKPGVFKRQEDINVCVEYLNPSFLVNKSNSGYRLVTAFADVERYSKPRPSLMPACQTLIPPFAKSLSGSTSLRLISRVPFIKSLSHASR